MSKLTIMSGPSGVGKSTLAQDMCRALHSVNKYCFIFSTDRYFIRPSGIYAWAAKELGAAHAWNFAKFSEFVQDSDFSKADVVAIIDNTNLRWDDFKKYVELALLSKWDVEIIRVDCPYTDEELFKRNTHGVPVETIHRQREKWQSKEHFNNQLQLLKDKLGVK